MNTRVSILVTISESDARIPRYIVDSRRDTVLHRR